MDTNKEYKEIKYYEVFKVIESSTPNDTPDDWCSLEKFTKQKKAEKFKEKEEKGLLEKIKLGPSFTNIHTSYFVRHQTLRLRK